MVNIPFNSFMVAATIIVVAIILKYDRVRGSISTENISVSVQLEKDMNGDHSSDPPK